MSGFFFRNAAKICFRIGDFCERQLESEKDKAAKRWVNDKGDETMRLDYSLLNENAFVMDLGGYKGEWASDIYAKYNCTVWIFEPFNDFAASIKERFVKNNKIRVFDFGLGKTMETRKLYIDDNSSSFYRQKNKSANSAEVTLKDIDLFFSNNNIRQVDLMKINIEGGEYDLLDRIIDTGLVKFIKNIQVQFHDFVPDAKKRMSQIQENLNLTHFLTYQYEFVWENWQRRQLNQVP
ncbi:MAG TPA: FkbM family methyltransferase [Chitinophagaceae bacterium]|nr:FkbM family methyltransferase [Chitinophagaceae bacterium]